ncbi:hypothetical protein REPUB_Repub03eG0174600 [Reevesia pubescens]
MYMSRLLPRSNSSFMLCSGNALKPEVLRLREDKFLVDAGIGSPRICRQDETTTTAGVAINRFENKVGYLNSVAGGGGGELLMKKRILERFFIDVVAGEPVMKERAAARFNDMVGSSLDVVAAEPILLNPHRFRQNLAWLELNKLWRSNAKVKGFFIEKVRGGYSVAIAGSIAFLPNSRFHKRNKQTSNDRFSIESINPKKRDIVVF